MAPLVMEGVYVDGKIVFDEKHPPAGRFRVRVEFLSEITDPDELAKLASRLEANKLS